MRRGLRWVLGITVLLTAAALWQRPSVEPTAPVVAAVDRPGRTEALPQPPSQRQPLPRELASWSLLPAARDIFAPVVAEPVQAAPAPPPAVTAAAPPPIVLAPSIAYRYLGRMTTPEGGQLMLLARGEQVVPVTVGAKLEEGYTVEAIEPQLVRLHYAEPDTLVEVPVPPPPEAP